MLKDKLRMTDQRVQTYESVLLRLMRDLGKEAVLSTIRPDPEMEQNLQQQFDRDSVSAVSLESTSTTATTTTPADNPFVAQLLFEKTALLLQNERLVKEIEELNCTINGRSGHNQPSNHLQIKSAKTPPQPKAIANCSSSPTTSGSSSSILSGSRLKLQRSQSLNLFDDHQERVYTPVPGVGNDNLSMLSNRSDCKSMENKSTLECEMCSNYELQLQSIQKRETTTANQLAKTQESIIFYKNEVKKEQELRNRMEYRFIQEAKDLEGRIDEFHRSIQAKEQQINQFRALFDQCVQQVGNQIAKVDTDHRRMSRELMNLQKENQMLLGKHIAKSGQLQREKIDMPQDLSEMQFYCLKLREDLISVLVAKERLEETYNSQILFMKEQQKAEQQQKESMEESMIQENDHLRKERDSMSVELETLRNRHQEQKILLQECQEKIASLVQEYQKQIEQLQGQVDELLTSKVSEMNIFCRFKFELID